VFAVRGGGTGDVSTQRKAAAALGLISAIGAYGGFLIPQALNLSFQASGGYAGAFLGFVAVYALLLVLTYVVYVRSARLSAHKI
jgi:NNP family nitrate/nitrite transporter-like MFS transporter